MEKVTSRVASLFRQKAVQQLGRVMINRCGFLVKCLFVYVIEVLIFAILYYYFQNNTDPLGHSTAIALNLLGAENYGKIEITQWFIGSIVIVYLCVNGAVKRFLQPVNPISLSGCVVTNRDRLKLRYWIMLRKGVFLYNVKLRVRLIEIQSMYDEESVRCYFDSEQSLISARGIRQCTFEFCHNNKNVISSYEQFCQVVCEHYEKNDLRLLFTVIGEDFDGHKFTQSKSYMLNAVFMNAQFARIRRSEYTGQSGYDIERSEYYKYQNYNKIIRDETELSKAISNQIASNGMITVIDRGEEKKEDPWYIRWVNNRTAAYYNKSSKKRLIKNYFERKWKIDMS